jgi:predicted DsbA family dithiol-disulfide isomerase
MKFVKVLVISDFACPWCYIGQRRLHKGIKRFMKSRTDVQLDVVWKPYQVDPDTAIDGESFHPLSDRRWGISGWTNHLKMEGSKDGCMFLNWKYWPNTLRAHQWIQYGLDRNLSDSDKMNAALFHAVFEKGQNISTVDTLMALSLELFPTDGNFDPNELRDYLQKNLGIGIVKQEIASLRQKYKIPSVPSFQFGLSDSASDEFESSYALSGAKRAVTFCKVFNRLVQE